MLCFCMHEHTNPSNCSHKHNTHAKKHVFTSLSFLLWQSHTDPHHTSAVKKISTSLRIKQQQQHFAFNYKPDYNKGMEQLCCISHGQSGRQKIWRLVLCMAWILPALKSLLPHAITVSKKIVHLTFNPPSHFRFQLPTVKFGALSQWKGNLSVGRMRLFLSPFCHKSYSKKLIKKKDKKTTHVRC